MSPTIKEDYDYDVDSTWKRNVDPIYLSNIDKKLSFQAQRPVEVREITRWRKNDIKGNRKSYYVKEVLNSNQNVVAIVEKTRLEKVNQYMDTYKCLPLRKKLMRCRVHVSEFALSITSNKAFEFLVILIIGLNCITLA